MDDDRYPLEEPFYSEDQFDPECPYHAGAERVLLGVIAHPEDPQAACYASGEESWETFRRGQEFAGMFGWLHEYAFGQYRVLPAGMQWAQERLREEISDTAAGRLTRREASVAHADILYQHILKYEHPLCRKLEARMYGREHDPLSADEYRLAATHVEMQSGPIRQVLIDRLYALADAAEQSRAAASVDSDSGVDQSRSSGG